MSRWLQVTEQNHFFKKETKIVFVWYRSKYLSYLDNTVLCTLETVRRNYVENKMNFIFENGFTDVAVRYHNSLIVYAGDKYCILKKYELLFNEYQTIN